MPAITVITEMHSPIKVCYDLARDIGFHIRSLAHTNEHAIAGRTDGLIELGETVTWQARHLGLTRRMTVRITAMDRPNHFRDEQTDGPFKRFVHDHDFEEINTGVVRMTDRVEFTSPYGWLGRAVDCAFMSNYVRRLITERGHALKKEAESIGQVG